MIVNNFLKIVVTYAIVLKFLSAIWAAKAGMYGHTSKQVFPSTCSHSPTH